MSADRVNVVVVGGGAIGCSVTYHLARAGAQVTLLERGPLCSEASSANAGMVMVSRREGIMLPIAQESVRLLRQASQELETDFELTQMGTLTLLRSEEEVWQQQSLVDRQRQRGVDIQMLDMKSALQVEPAVSPNILGGMYSPIDCRVNPYALTLAMGRAARRLGATIRTGVEVTGLKGQGGRMRTALTRDGEVSGDFLVVATGAWSPILCRTIGLELPVEPGRGQIVVTEPLPPTISGSVRAVSGHIYVHPVNHGNQIVIGSASEKVGYNKTLSPDRLSSYAVRAVEMVPSLGGVKVTRAWAGLRPLSPDDDPILGEVPGYEGLILATGHSRTGVGLSAATSKMVADLIMAGGAAFSLEPFSLARFPSAN